MKKKTKNSYRIHTSSDMEYSKIMKIAFGVMLVLVLTYFITALVTGEIQFGKKQEEKKKETAIQYEEIMAGEILNRSLDEYYVFLFNFTDTFASYYLSLKDSYTEKEDSLSVYIVDLEKHVNKDIVLEEGNDYINHPSNIDSLKVSNPTLLKISNHRVTERIVGRDDVLKFFEDSK